MTTSQFIPNSESKNRIGKQIKTLHQIRDASLNKQSIVIACAHYSVSHNKALQIGYYGPHPAAFILNRIGSDLCMLLDRGIYIYKPKTRKQGFKKGFAP
jgi:hypothetical protein